MESHPGCAAASVRAPENRSPQFSERESWANFESAGTYDHSSHEATALQTLCSYFIHPPRESFRERV